MNSIDEQTESEDILENVVKPAIYSRGSIWGFSIFFTPLFGGIMLMQNLKDTDKKKEANLVLIVSILMTVLAVLLVTVFDIQNRSVSLVFNIACAGVLTEYFYKKYFPNEGDYEKKKIWKPLIIGVLIIAIFVILIFVAQDQVV
jgi:hypothetical protein